MGRTWTYAYTGSDLTSVTDPMRQQNHLHLRRRHHRQPAARQRPADDHQPQRPARRPRRRRRHRQRLQHLRAGHHPDRPHGLHHHVNYCVNAADGDCMNTATGTGTSASTDPDGNTTVYDYTQGTLAAQSVWTGTTLTSSRTTPPTPPRAAPAAARCSTSPATDGDGNLTTYTYDPAGTWSPRTLPRTASALRPPRPRIGPPSLGPAQLHRHRTSSQPLLIKPDRAHAGRAGRSDYTAVVGATARESPTRCMTPTVTSSM